MSSMFNGARAFNQNLSSWKVSKVTNCSYFRDGSTLTKDSQPKFKKCKPN